MKVIVMIGSKSDEKYVDKSGIRELFAACEIDWKLWVISAHRNLELVIEKSKDIIRPESADFADLVIAAAGMAADLPKVVAAATNFSLPVIGVALPSDAKPDASDALGAMTSVPKGCPFVIASGIGAAALLHAGITAVQMLTIGEDVKSKMIRNDFLAGYYRENVSKEPIIPLYQSERKEGLDDGQSASAD